MARASYILKKDLKWVYSRHQGIVTKEEGIGDDVERAEWQGMARNRASLVVDDGTKSCINRKAKRVRRAREMGERVNDAFLYLAKAVQEERGIGSS